MDGPHAGRFRDGVREEVVATEVELVYSDGSAVRVDRTTLGFVAHHADRITRHRSLIDAIQWTERLPVTVTSASRDAASLAALLADADRLVPPSLTLNGRRFEAP